MSRKRILVVDDEADFLSSLAEILEEEGYAVEKAVNGREALARLSGAPLPSVVILDLMMPVLGGGEVYAAMRADPRLVSIPVIVSTSDPAQAPAGATFLRKPIDLGRMLETVRRLC
ncbi:MAG TPA: response regulator [Thermoanaerobaculia bacterium]|nr:response regulator [Thermoanaerobaculia bacterium]